VHESIKDEFERRIVEAAEKIEVSFGHKSLLAKETPR
jgi:hypothetical protein